MHRVYFDLGVFTYWSEESLEGIRPVSGGVLVSDEADLTDVGTEMDPDILEMLRSLHDEGIALHICDTLPASQILAILRHFRIDSYFGQVISAESAEALAKCLQESGSRDGFSLFVGCKEIVVEAAELSRIPTIAYGENLMDVAGRALGYALYPLEIEDQIRTAMVVYEVARKTIEKKARILGIDGIEFAGKKFFARSLGRYFDILGKEYTIVNLEDFHRAVEETYKGEDPVESYYFNGFNNEKLIGEVLAPFVRDGKIDKVVYCLDSTNDAFVNERHYRLSENGVMVLVGPMMYREPLIRYFDVTVYFRVDYREAELRASLLDTPIYGEDPQEVFRKKNIPAHKMYVQRYDPQQKRDFVIDNSNFHRPVFIV